MVVEAGRIGFISRHAFADTAFSGQRINVFLLLFLCEFLSFHVVEKKL